MIAAWPEDVKLRIRQHPEVFSTRVIFNQFVSRGFKDEAALRAAIETKIVQATKPGREQSEQRSAAVPKLIESKTRQSIKILEDKLRAGIKIKDSAGKGKIEIAYENAADLQRILEILALT